MTTSLTMRELLKNICDAEEKTDLIRVSNLCQRARENLKEGFPPEDRCIARYCEERDDNWQCSLEAGHDGDHLAGRLTFKKKLTHVAEGTLRCQTGEGVLQCRKSVGHDGLHDSMPWGTSSDGRQLGSEETCPHDGHEHALMVSGKCYKCKQIFAEGPRILVRGAPLEGKCPFAYTGPEGSAWCEHRYGHIGNHVAGKISWISELSVGAWGSDVPGQIHDECVSLRELLLAKNKAYGNSALDPIRVFSTADPVEQIKVRLDDKLSRLKRGSAAGEDVIQDILGYLILLKIALKEPNDAR